MSCPFIKYISNQQHYNEVIACFSSVRSSLWIGTADIKDVYVKAGDKAIPLLGVMDRLVRHGVKIRLLHAKEPGPAFREDFDRYPLLVKSLQRALCPRIHFKIILFDSKTAYIGSANLTGAGIGMKNENRRNFEAGILTDEPTLVRAAINQFGEVWHGDFCKACGRKKFCTDRIG